MRNVLPAVLLAAAAAAQHNLLLLVGDDIGVDAIGCYALGTLPPPTPVIDGLAAGGIRFDRAHACPTCSPTRACIQTGRYPFRTGVGVALGGNAAGLATSEVTLPELLAGSGYARALIGKWHLGDDAGAATPNQEGWPHFVGTLQGALPSYTAWPKVTNGTTAPATAYATTDQVDEALAWLQGRTTPWCLLVCFNAAHTPLHEPPAALHTFDLSGRNPATTPVPFYKAMVQAMDTEIGRLLAGIGSATLAATNVVFVGDNGTPANVTRPPFDAQHAKGTLYEGGTRVPLIVTGPAVVAPGRSSSAPVDASDLFVTAAALCGVDARAALPAATALDGVSLLPILANTATSTRAFAYAEQAGSAQQDGQAVVGARFKLIRFAAGTHALYDLDADPHEQSDLLLQPLSAAAASAFVDLREWLARLRGESLALGFGAGCAGTDAALSPPVAGPRLGQPHTVTASTAWPGAAGALGVLGWSRTTWLAAPLPAALDGAGMPGCTLWISLDELRLLATTAGTAVWTETVPGDVALLGLSFHQQVAIGAAGSNALDLLATGAVAAVIGP